MKRHTTIGAEILADSGTDLLEMAREIALSHHEKWDGSGYPNQLAGSAIPEAARIVAITDVFDALTSERPYKKPWTVDETVRFMNANAGKQFDPHLLNKFTSLIPEVQQIRERFAEPVLISDAELIDKR
jgi:putative two-component system response regulator